MLPVAKEVGNCPNVRKKVAAQIWCLHSLEPGELDRIRLEVISMGCSIESNLNALDTHANTDQG